MKFYFLILAVSICHKGLAQEGKVFQSEILITEIFPDPSTSLHLPKKEFIEIFNNTNDIIHLENYLLSDSSSRYPFPSYSLASKNFLILCKASDTSSFKDFGSVLGLKSFITLNNGGDVISVISSKNRMIDKVSYSKNYQSGITLERISLNTLCDIPAVWKPSLSPLGGTPGKFNSYLQKTDTTQLFIKSIQVIKENNLTVDLEAPINPSHPLFKILIDKKEIPSSDISFSNTKSSLNIMLPDSLSKNNNFFVELKNIVTCTGSLVPSITQNFFRSQKPDSLDLILNEILFDPFTGYPDFVEVLNRSEKYIGLDSVKVKSLKENGLEEVCYVANNSRIIGPGEIIAVTSDVEKLCEKYTCREKDNIIKVDLPSFNNDKGVVILYYNNKVIDRFNYSASFHFPLLENKEGVSLERIGPYLMTNNKDSWHSAAETAGFATPASENSNKQLLEDEGNWTVEPKAFSPNSDGYNDFSSLLYHVNNPSTVATINIYNSEGLLIKRLLNNTTISSKGTIQWDGTNEELLLVPVGHYIIKIDTFTLAGQIEEFKRTVVITSP